MNGAPADLAARCRVARVIGAALVLAVFVYAVPVEVIRARRGGFAGFAPAAPVDTLRMLLVVATIADLVLVRFIRSRMLAASPGAARPSGNASPPTQRLFTASIVSMTMCLAVAVYGLVLFLIGGRPLDFYGFAVVSLLGLAVYFPRLRQWEEWARGEAHPR